MEKIGLHLFILVFVFVACSPDGNRNDLDKSENATTSIQQEMILIPAGSFIMGIKPNPDAKYIDNAAHEVKLDGFLLDKYEITNSMYQEFCEACGHSLPEFWGIDVFFSGDKFLDHPVVGVTWSDAAKYAKWAGGPNWM